MRKLLLLLSCCFIVLQQSYCQVVINEFQANNVSTVMNPDGGDNDDWVELYNKGTQEVDLGGYFLTNEKSDTTKWQFPVGTKIQPKGFLLIWLDNANNNLHASFKLDKNGDIIILYDNTLQRLDIMNFYEMEDDYSIGRISDGGDVWASYSTATPGGTNNSVSTVMDAPEPIFSEKAGYYDAPVTVGISSALTNAKIYYTLDGSIPTTSSALYNSPITINVNKVLKAIVVRSGYNNSRVTTRTYFIGEHSSDLPVISIGVDPYDFFDETDGMYMMGPNASPYPPNDNANFWEDREEPVTFEYFVEGKQKVEVNAGIKIFGGWSRRFAQRSFSINCNQLNGDERMRYKFFGDKSNDVYKQIVVRNSGSDVNSLRYRDLMLQNMVSDRMDIDYQAGQPAIVYINGEYWGIMNLREKVQERYLKDNYGLEEEDITLIANYRMESENGGSTDEFWTMYEYFDYTDFSNSTNYNSAKSQIDMNEYINYQIAEIYFSNVDWPAYNIKYWKKNGNDNKWRWILYDLDQSTAYYQECNQYVNTLYNASNVVGGFYWASSYNGTMMLRKLFENTQFKNEFVQRFAAHINTTFSTERFSLFINKYDSIYANEKPFHLERWGYDDSLWNAEKVNLHLFAEERPALMQGFIKEMFGISGMSTLTIESRNEGNPGIKICSVEMDGSTVVGDYFKNIPFTVSVQNTTRKFIHWEDASGNVLSTELSYTVTLSADKKIIAVFDQSSGLDNVFINEIMASNSNTITDNKEEYEDWIELYNANDYSIDISGLYITDDLTDPTKYMIPKGTSNETVIPAKGFILLWADDEKSEGSLHVEFKLSGSGEQVGLAQVEDDKVNWIDTVTFSQQISDISYGRSIDGGGEFIAFTKTTPKSSNTGETPISEKLGNVIKVYPSMVTDYFIIHKDSTDKMNVEIYSLAGRSIANNLEINEKDTKVNIADYKAGIYVVKVSGASEVKTFKIIKK